MRFSPGCSCCDAGCCGCAAVPASYDVVISGVTGGAIFDDLSDCHCPTINGTYNLADSGDCFWLYNDPDYCTGSGSSGAIDFIGIDIRLYCDETTWYLVITVVLGYDDASQRFYIAFYTKSRATWSCLGTNVMDFSSAGVTCSGWPATMTVTPV